MTEHDEAWNPDKRESFGDLYKRINNFLHWLSWNELMRSKRIDHRDIEQSTDQQKLLVVSHGVWIECLFHHYKPEVLSGGKRVHNCDLYCVNLVCLWGKEVNENHDHQNWRCIKISLDNVKMIE